jgi:uncharacterized protein with HEPN domain
MRRDLVFLSEMIDAAEQAMALVAGRSIGDIEGDRRTRDALLWNVTVLGEAANRVSELTRNRFPGISWQEPTRLRNRVVHGARTRSRTVPSNPGPASATANQTDPGRVFTQGPLRSVTSMRRR